MKNISKILFNPELLATLVVFILSQIFFVSLCISSYNEYRAQNTQNLLQFNLNNTAARINNITSMGRDVQNYQGIFDEIYDLKLISKADDVFIVDNQGDLVRSQSVTKITHLNLAELKNGQITINDHLYLSAPFFDIKDQRAGLVLASLGDNFQEGLSEAEESALYKQVGFGMLISIAIFIVFFIFFNRQKPSQTKRSISRFKSFLLPFFIAQLIIIAFIAPSMKNSIEDFNFSIQRSALGSINKDFSAVARLGLSFDEVSGIDTYFATLKEHVSFIKEISLRDANDKYIAGDDIISAHSLPIVGQNKIIGSLNLTTQIDFTQFIDIGLKLLTLFFISTILANELSSLLKLEINRIQTRKKKIFFEPKLVRPLGFLIVFGMFLPVSIVPVFMGQYASDLAFLPDNFVKSLAVSTEMFGVGISSLLILFLDKALSNWKKLLPWCLVLLIAATTISYFSFNAASFLLGRLCYGLGYGGMVVSLQLLVMDITDENSHGTGMSGLFAGLFSGVLCGLAAGGIIADKVSLRAVFLVSAIITLFNLCLITYLFVKREANRKAQVSSANAQESHKLLPLSKVTAFIKDPKSLSLMFLQVIPYSVIGIGFFNFFLPVTIQENGMGASTVGQLNFIYSFLIIMLSPLMGKLLDKVEHKYLILTLALGFSAAVPLAFGLPNIIVASIIAMVLLGISASINESGQPTYMTTLEVAKRIGPTISIKVLDSFLRIGQITGPMLVALIMGSFGTQGFTYLAIGVALCAILFFISQQFFKNHTTKEQEETAKPQEILNAK